MLSSKDLNFVGYTYKNFELVNEHEASGIGFFFLFLQFLYITLCSYLSSLLLIYLFSLCSRVEKSEQIKEANYQVSFW
jgi:hypothetical protein